MDLLVLLVLLFLALATFNVPNKYFGWFPAGMLVWAIIEFVPRIHHYFV